MTNTPHIVAATARSAAAFAERAAPGIIDADVVIIGTGAGGAVAGTELAKAGKRVVFLEAGGAFAKKDFARRSLPWSLTKLWSSKGAQASQSQPIVIVPSGRTVGGSTVLNSAICFKPPAHRLQEYANVTSASWWLPETLSPYVDEIWARVGVVPTHAGIGRTNNTLFERGAKKLGYDNGWIDRNAPGCTGCGVCHMGCPSGGKASVDKSILPEALNHGARIITRARARMVDVVAGRAAGVIADVVDADSERPIGELRVNAPVVVVAGGGLFSPIVLQRSGIRNAHLGKHLAIHPGAGVFGEFDEPVCMWDGVPQGYYAHIPDDDHVLLETANAGPSEIFAMFARAGDDDSIRRMAHMAMVGAMIRDSGGGSVEFDDDDGVMRPRITIAFNDRDMLAFRNGAKACVRAWFAAGARRVWPAIKNMQPFTDEGAALAHVDTLTDVTRLEQPYGSHPHGTCRMGKDAASGVIDGRGEVFGLPGCYVMDGSIFPTTLGVNPQISIMSAALYLSRTLSASL